MKELAAILKDKGEDALVDALKKLDAGRINQLGDTGNQIAIAEKANPAKITVITIITARKISTVELKRKAAHADYPLGYLSVTLKENGEGTGKMMTAAKVKFDKKKGHFKLEPYGNGYSKVTNVAPNPWSDLFGVNQRFTQAALAAIRFCRLLKRTYSAAWRSIQIEQS